MTRKFLPIFLILTFLLAGCQNLFPTPTATPNPAGYTPKYEKADCPFDASNGGEVECGYLTVPENRAKPQGNTVRLAVARLKATGSSTQPDPIIYLEGGPGGSTLRNFTQYYSTVFEPFHKTRDVILFDQRGTGYSTPALDCTELTQLDLDTLNVQLNPEQEDSKTNDALKVCRDRLAAKGIDLSAYNSAANAADLNDLRVALGIKEWNLYGISYGTRLALTALRDTSSGIRSVVLDSVYPPQASLVTEPPASFSRSLTQLFDACSADADCNKAYPNLKQVLFDTAKKLNATPAKIKITQPDLGGIGTPGKQLDALLDGNSFLGTVFQLLYSTEMIPSLPALIYQAKEGKYDIIASIQAQLLGQNKDMSRGMYFSVECVEEVPFDTPEKVAEAYKAVPDLADAMGTPTSMFNSCKVWNVTAAAANENQAVSSSVPTLVLSGQLDPITPPAWGKLAAANLSKSFFFEVPTAGHGSSLSTQCPQQMVLSFFDSPSAAPDSSCLSTLKMKFSVPVSKLDVKMGPFDNKLMGLSGLVPAEWKAVSGIPGFYTPSGTATDSTQLLIQAGQLTQEQLLASLSSSLQQSGIEIKTSTLDLKVQSAGGLKWSLYEADGGTVKIDLALASSGKKTFIVLLQSPWNQREALVQAVLVPVAEALISQ